MVGRELWEWTQRGIGLVLVLVAVVSVLLVYARTEELRRLTACQADYNEAFKQANNEHTEAAKQDRAAIRVFLQALAATRDQQARTDAYQTYLRSLDEADARRSSHPIPTERCG